MLFKIQLEIGGFHSSLRIIRRMTILSKLWKVKTIMALDVSCGYMDRYHIQLQYKTLGIHLAKS